MYLYFDVNGNLKEVIQIPVRQGSAEFNKIYAFISPTTEELDGDTYKKLDEFYDSAKINFELLDTNVNLNPNGGSSVSMSEITKQIPFDKNRDLKFFKYGYNYEFWTVELPTTVTSVNGVITASIYLYTNGFSNDFPLNRFSFNVEASIGVKPDSTMSESQYSYLYNKYHNLEAQFIPYTGATQNIDLGSHELTAKKVNVGMLTIQQNSSTEYEIHGNYQYSLTLDFGSVNILGDTVATQDWVADQGYLTEHQSLDGYVTYTAANDIDMENYDIKEVNTLSFSYGGYINIDSSNNMNIRTSNGDIIISPDSEAYLYDNSSDNNKIATLGLLPKKGVIGTFNTGSFTLTQDGNYILENIPLSGFIDGSDLLIITWGNCFAICPIPTSGPGRVCAAMWDANGEAKTIRVRYELKSNNTLLDIALQGGFVPPSDYTGYIINYKIV